MKELESIEKGLSSIERNTDDSGSKINEIEFKQTQEVDERSIYVGNVDYNITAKQLKDFFSDCGPINRVTIPSNKEGAPKGFAYIEFMEKEHVKVALSKENLLLNGREIIVKEKRTNIPSSILRGGQRGRGGFRGSRGFRGGRGGPRGGRGVRGGFRGRGTPRGGPRNYHHQPY